MKKIKLPAKATKEYLNNQRNCNIVGNWNDENSLFSIKNKAAKAMPCMVKKMK